jgi:hypothetical protein
LPCLCQAASSGTYAPASSLSVTEKNPCLLERAQNKKGRSTTIRRLNRAVFNRETLLGGTGADPPRTTRPPGRRPMASSRGKSTKRGSIKERRLTLDQGGLRHLLLHCSFGERGPILPSLRVGAVNTSRAYSTARKSCVSTSGPTTAASARPLAPLKLLTWNAHSLTPTKELLLQNLISDTQANIVAVTEAELETSIKPHLQGFDTFQPSSTTRRRVVLLVRKDLKATALDIGEDDVPAVWVTIGDRDWGSVLTIFSDWHRHSAKRPLSGG